VRTRKNLGGGLFPALPVFLAALLVLAPALPSVSAPRPGESGEEARVLVGFRLTPGAAELRALRAAVEELLPGHRFQPLGQEHVIYKSFFLVSRPSGRRGGWQPEGLIIDGRVAVLWTAGDVLGALSRDLLGSWRYHCEPDGERQREETFRLAINILMYAVCLDYKNDRVHLPFILRRRRL